METLQITKQNASAAYNAADANTKKVLEVLLGKENILPQKITDRVKTFDDVLLVTGENKLSNLATLFAYNGKDETMLAAQAAAKLTLIAKALNEGWEPDWTNSSQYKWYPWFNMESGSGLSFCDADNWCSDTSVGSRLCYKSKELAEYAGKHFIDIYTQFFIINK